MPKQEGRWHRNQRTGDYELRIAGVFVAAVELPPVRGRYYVGPHRWRLYGHPEIQGEAKGTYAAQRAARKALREVDK